jgi:ribosome maturation protein Sdo1
MKTRKPTTWEQNVVAHALEQLRARWYGKQDVDDQVLESLEYLTANIQIRVTAKSSE